jgi:hypothetical protein
MDQPLAINHDGIIQSPEMPPHTEQKRLELQPISKLVPSSLEIKMKEKEYYVVSDGIVFVGR